MEHHQDSPCEIVRGEYFSCASDPSITVRNGSVKFSMSCLNQLPDVDYILFIMYRSEKKLVITHCSPELRDAIRWCGMNPTKRKPKTIICKEFYRRMLALMQWSESCRYKISGKVSSDNDVIAFDLTSALVYCPGTDGRFAREPEYSNHWGDGFGMTVEHHRANPLLKRFAEDTEITVIANSHNDHMENNHES